ncbi:MAG: hypothetical protein LBB43_06165 [Spirochaetaceae bacterium]|nr:hypothetical protein [Spirochaetaceae bacterium]
MRSYMRSFTKSGGGTIDATNPHQVEMWRMYRVVVRSATAPQVQAFTWTTAYPAVQAVGNKRFSLRRCALSRRLIEMQGTFHGFLASLHL